jgi:hypothetical protein
MKQATTIIYNSNKPRQLSGASQEADDGQRPKNMSVKSLSSFSSALLLTSPTELEVQYVCVVASPCVFAPNKTVQVAFRFFQAFTGAKAKAEGVRLGLTLKARLTFRLSGGFRCVCPFAQIYFHGFFCRRGCSATLKVIRHDKLKILYSIRRSALPMSSSIAIYPIPLIRILNTLAVGHREILRLRLQMQVTKLVARISFRVKVNRRHDCGGTN